MSYELRCERCGASEDEGALLIEDICPYAQEMCWSEAEYDDLSPCICCSECRGRCADDI